MYQDHQLNFFAAAREAPDREALFFHDRMYTYQELSPLVERAASYFQRVPQGESVALCSNNSLGLYCAIVALLTEKIPFVLVHPRLTPSERQVIVDDAKPFLFLMEEELHTLLDMPPATIRDEEIRQEDTLAILYTSGTTGTPKGAVLGRSAFLASAAASEKNIGWREADRWLLCLPLCHIGGLSIVTRCLLARRCVVMLPRFDAGQVLRTISSQKITLLSVVPTMMKALLDADSENILASLRVVLLGGAATPEPMMRECAARRIMALTTYGLTEACSQVTTQRLRDPSLFEAGSGHPLDATLVEITGEDGAALPPGNTGQIQVTGPTVMRGYLHQKPLEAEKLLTGDLGFFDTSGNLHVVSRRTDLIVSGGENVYPLEVERSLESFHGVTQALVFSAPDETWGQIVVVALIVNEVFSLDTLKKEIRERLAPHKRPKMFCTISALPLLPSGKPNRAGALALLREKLTAL
jgi:O-succinylbenzoic acid--CoA ligase